MTEPPANLILANARLVLEGEVMRGCLWLRSGVIAAVDSGHRVPAGAVDCDGDLVLPGLVEPAYRQSGMARPAAPRGRLAAQCRHSCP